MKTAWIVWAATAVLSLDCTANLAASKANLVVPRPVLTVAANTAEPQISPVTAAILVRAIRANRGKVVLVNFWATFCPTCVDEFPALIKTSKLYKNSGLVVLAVSADSPDDLDTKVRPFLQKNHVTQKTYILTEDPDTFVPNFDKSWLDGGLPRTYVFDRHGRFKFVTSNGQTSAGFAHLIKPYL